MLLFLSHLSLSSRSFSKRKRLYQIGEILGKGGYGEVKLATRLEDGQQFAVKIVPKINCHDPVIQIARQDNLLKMDHKHVVKLYEWFE